MEPHLKSSLECGPCIAGFSGAGFSKVEIPAEEPVCSAVLKCVRWSVGICPVSPEDVSAFGSFLLHLGTQDLAVVRVKPTPEK